MVLSCSDKFKQEYCCTVVQIGECFPIEGADRIQRTVVNGMDMVISKTIKPGDIMIYAANETQLERKFLAKNNLFSISDFEYNENGCHVGRLLLEGKNDEAKALCGFFNKYGRVKMLKLKGVYSLGFLFPPEYLNNWMPDLKLKAEDLTALVGTDFDTVNGELFVKAYIPEPRDPGKLHQRGAGPKPKEKRLDTLVDPFPFHYDSKQLQREIEKFTPDMVIAITVKVHGTSAIYSRRFGRIPLALPWWQKVVNLFAKPFGKEPYHPYTVGMRNYYSSRRVILNRYQSPKDTRITPTNDEYAKVYKDVAPLLSDNMTVYGEIVGFKPYGGKHIQTNYDYMCRPGECVFMPYRIIQDGVEWDMEDVIRWVVEKHFTTHTIVGPELLYHGPFKDLYPNIPVDENWHKNVLKAMKQDKERLGMELNEPLCKNKVPREGVCIRVDGHPELGNFKLKCSKFLDKESSRVDAGEIDPESIEAYS